MTIVYEYLNKKEIVLYAIDVYDESDKIKVVILKDGNLWSTPRVKGDNHGFQTSVYAPTFFEKIRGITHAMKIKKAVDEYKEFIEEMFSGIDSCKINIQKNQKYIDEHLNEFKYN